MEMQEGNGLLNCLQVVYSLLLESRQGVIMVGYRLGK